MLVQEADPAKGGGSLPELRAECEIEEVAAGLFGGGHPHVVWQRIEEFRVVSLKEIARAVLLHSPNYQGVARLPLHIPGELQQKTLALKGPASHCPVSLVVACPTDRRHFRAQSLATPSSLSPPLQRQSGTRSRAVGLDLTPRRSESRSRCGSRPQTSAHASSPTSSARRSAASPSSPREAGVRALEGRGDLRRAGAAAQRPARRPAQTSEQRPARGPRRVGRSSRRRRTCRCTCRRRRERA